MTPTAENKKEFDYGSLAPGYYDRVYHEGGRIQSFWHKYKFEKIASLIHSDERTRILDVGCAAGSFLGTFRKPYGVAVGIDGEEAQIAYARKKYARDKLEYVAGDIRRLSYAPQSFDYIVLSEVVEHISEDESIAMLSQLRSFLKPTGSLILTTPNYKSLWPLLEWMVNRLSPVDYEHQHIHKLDRKKCTRLLDRCGFRIRSMNTFFMLGFLFAAVSRPLARSIGRAESMLLPHFGSILLVDAVPA